MDFSQIAETFLPSSGGLLVIRAVVALVLVFFLPGFAWTLVFFKKINNAERLALSFGLSIALVVLSVFALNFLFNIRINGFNSLVTIVVITVIPAAIYLFRRYAARGTEAPDGD
ncbi:MAG TPA: DUF1616 domain-containing protein [Dehalococcoidales bacterium]|nr:DUF1616 domain-containing protein [Dehalococcoidales bacterium]